jgi:hypothetical protein
MIISEKQIHGLVIECHNYILLLKELQIRGLLISTDNKSVFKLIEQIQAQQSEKLKDYT